MKKIIFLGFLLILFSSFVSAVDIPNLEDTYTNTWCFGSPAFGSCNDALGTVANLFDDSTTWTGGFYLPQAPGDAPSYIDIELNDTYDISKIRINGGVSPQAIESFIHISSDNITWGLGVASGELENNWSNWLNFDNVSAKYIRWNLTSSGDAISRYGEIEIEGSTFTPPPPTPTIVNESIETVFNFEQTGFINVVGSTVTIFSGDIEILNNNSKLYIGVISEVLSTLDNEITCSIIFDSVNVGSFTRSNTAGQYGSTSILSDTTIIKNVGNYTLEYECQRTSGGGQVRVEKSEGVIHLLKDEFNNTINNGQITFGGLLTVTTFTPGGGTLSIVINDTLEDQNVVQNLIYDWSASVTNEGDSSAQFNNYINITPDVGDSIICEQYPRQLNPGGTGSLGGTCLLKNVTPNIRYVAQVYFLGNNFTVNFNLIGKNTYSHITQTNSTTLNGTSITSTNTTLKSIGIEVDSSHGNVEVFVKAGVPLNNSVVGSASELLFNITDSQGTSETYRRTVNENIGVAILHHTFKDLSPDNYTISLVGNCANNCTIQGGEMVAYVVSPKEIVPNFFNISAYDIFDNSTILNFSLDTGEMTTTGNIQVFTSDTLKNLTILSTYFGGYFNQTVLNHNTSNDLNQSMNQTNIGWNCFEKVSGNILNCTNPTESTGFNYNVIGNPHTQSINVSGYFENQETFSISALQSEILNSTFYTTNLTINSSSVNGVVSDCSYIVYSNTYSFNENITGNPLGSIGLINGSYDITADCVGYAINTTTVVVNSSLQTFNFSLFLTNSVNITFYDEDLPENLFTSTVTFSLINGGTSNQSTSTGFNFLSNLTVGDYEIRYKSTDWDERSMFFTITNRSTQVLAFYLSNSSQTTNYIIRVADQSDSDIINAKVLLQRQYINFNGEYRTIEECKTNNDGECDLFIQESSEIVYRFIILVNGEVVKTTAEQNIVNVAGVTTKKIVLRISTGTSFLDSYNSITGLFGNVRYDNNTNIVNYTFIDGLNSVSGGCLIITRSNFANLSQEKLSSQCTTATTGSFSVDVSSYIINGTILKMSGIVNFTNTFLILDEVSIGSSDRGVNYDEDDALLFTVIFFIMVSFATILIPNMIIQVLLNLGLLYGISFLGFNLVSVSLVMLFMAVGIIINYNKKNTEEVVLK